MSARTPNRNKHSGFSLSTLITSIIGFVLIVAIMVQSGAWAQVAPLFNLPPITSLTQLLPGADAHRRNDLGLNLSLPKGSDMAPDSSDRAHDMGKDVDSDVKDLPKAASGPLSIAQALDIAQHMPTAQPHTAGYDRESEFGGWAKNPSLCGSGTTRDFILNRDLKNVTMNDKCQVTSGRFTDPYTGKTMDFKRGKDSGLVQIDHVVALNDAWASGLWKADRAKDRVAYANDPDVLLASEGKANMAKGNGVNLKGTIANRDWSSSTPSVWLPDNKAYQCDYMAKRVYIKHKYDLTMSEWEKAETVGFLKQCAAR